MHTCRFLLYLILVLLTQTTLAANSYRFERMWPTLQQPWYFYQPEDVLVLEDGSVIVLDTSNNRMMKLSDQGKVISVLETKDINGNKFPASAIAIDESSLIYVANSNSALINNTSVNIINVYDINLAFLKSIHIPQESTYRSIESMGIFEDTLYLGIGRDAKRFGIGTYNIATGTINNDITSDDSATKLDVAAAINDIEMDESGNIYITANKKVLLFDKNGTFIKTLADYTESGNLVKGIALDSRGFLYACSNFVIDVYNTQSVLVDVIPVAVGFYETCHDVEVIEENDTRKIMFTGQRGVYTQSEEGALLDAWTSRGIALEGKFSWPTSIALENNNVYVLDGNNNQVTRINSFGIVDKLIPNTTGSASAMHIAGNSLFISHYFRSQDGINTPSITEYDLNGNKIRTIDLEEDNARLLNFTTDDQGNFYGEIGRITDIFIVPKLAKYDRDGKLLAFVDNKSRFGMVGLAFDPDGNFWATVDGELRKLDENLQTLKSYSIEKNGHLQIDSKGRFFLGREQIIEIYSPDMKLLDIIGGYGSSPGQLVVIEDIKLDKNDNLFTIDFTNLRLQKYSPVTVVDNSRAIIVAAGGPFAGNALWDATQISANFAYRTLTYQGFTKEDIYYLSANTELDLDLNGVADDVDGDATNANLEYALTQWATEADNVLVYLVDHGGVNTFRMSGTEILTASDLADWIDTMQLNIPGRLTLIYDACESGTFQEALIPAPGSNRIVVTSTSPGENAVFISQGAVSFSNFFWTHAFNGLSLGDAFTLSSSALASTTDHQHPMLDINGDGVSSPVDISAMANVYIGNGTDLAASAPKIGSISAPQVLDGTSTARIEAKSVEDEEGLARVWAVVRPPEYQQAESGNPVLELPNFDLLPTSTNDTFAATWDGFTTPGTYLVSVYAADRYGNTSVPQLTTVSVDNPLAHRAILVAGLPPEDKNSSVIYNTSANIAYDALLQQGYNDDTIYYLSVEGTIGVDALPTASNLEFAIEQWATRETYDLVIYLAGTGSDKAFAITPDEIVSATALDSMLNSARNEIPGKITVVLDVDAGGSFIETLSDKENRIIVTSTENKQNANFFANGDISFSKFYWRQVFNGATVRDAYLFAKRAMRFADGLQEAQLDDDGDGLGDTKADGQLARFHRHGNGILLAGDEPLVSGLTVSGGPDNPLIEVFDITSTSTIAKVFAVITAPSGTGRTVTLGKDGDVYFRDNIPFYESGTHEVAAYAQDTNGNVSLPVTKSFSATPNTIAGAEEKQLEQAMTSNRTSTTAKFTAGAYLESSSFRSESFSTGDTVVITGSVQPQAADIGKAADVFVVMLQETTSGTRLTYTDLDGNAVRWNGRLTDLQPALERDALKSSETFGVWTGTVEAGSYRVFIGYMLAEGGPIHFNGRAYRITVN